MKWSKCIVTLSIIIVLFLGGCGDADMEGVILEVGEESDLLFSEGMTEEAYEGLKDKKYNERVEENISLIMLHYTGDLSFSEGDVVEVWIDGEILTSYPGRADAT
jgi:hypothetical protein